MYSQIGIAIQLTLLGLWLMSFPSHALHFLSLFNNLCNTLHKKGFFIGKGERKASKIEVRTLGGVFLFFAALIAFGVLPISS